MEAAAGVEAATGTAAAAEYPRPEDTSHGSCPSSDECRWSALFSRPSCIVSYHSAAGLDYTGSECNGSSFVSVTRVTNTVPVSSSEGVPSTCASQPWQYGCISTYQPPSSSLTTTSSHCSARHVTTYPPTHTESSSWSSHSCSSHARTIQRVTSPIFNRVPAAVAVLPAVATRAVSAITSVVCSPHHSPVCCTPHRSFSAYSY